MIACFILPSVAETKKLFYTNAWDKPLAEPWKIIQGEWKIVEGALSGAELEADHHAASIRLQAELPVDFMVSYRFKQNEANAATGFFINSPDCGHLCSIKVNEKELLITNHKSKPAAKLLEKEVALKKNEWHQLAISVVGKKMTVKLNEQIFEVSSDDLTLRKFNAGPFINKGGVSFKNIQIFKITP
jgi:hypothetical protein